MWHSRVMAGLALSALALSTQAFDESGYDFDDGYYIDAKVVEAEPIKRTVQIAVPREVCWDERVRHVERDRWRHHNSALPTILGGVVGGVLGNQARRNRGALTVAGTLIGAAVGHGVSRRHHQHEHHYRAARSYTTVERRCEIQREYQDVQRIDGYNVTYRYQGRNFTTRTKYDPGRRIRVRVQVEPMAEFETMTHTEHGYPTHRLSCDGDCFDT